MEEYVSVAMLVILGFFLLAITGGMLFGMMRGPRRTGKRLVILIAFFILALLITPLISSALVKSPLGKAFYDLIMDAVGDDPTVTNAIDNMGDVASFALGLPLLIINLLVYWVLLFLFRFIVSPIVSKLLLRKIAPKRDAEGNKIQHSKLAGLGMGALQGMIIFAFVFIPVTGLMSSLNKIDRYEPRIGGVKTDVLNTEWSEFNDINKGIRDANKEVQGSPIGVITRFSGMQLLGDAGLGYFWNIRAGGTNVNMKREIEVGFELSRDAAAIYDLVINIDDNMQLITVFSNDANVEYFNSIVNKIFGLGTVRLALNSEFGEFMRAEDMLDKADMSSVVDDQATFNNSIYNGIANLNANFVREDLLSLIELMRLIFAEHAIPGGTQPSSVSLFRDIDNLILVLDSSDIVTDTNGRFTNKTAAVEDACTRLSRTLQQVKITTPKKGNTPETTRTLVEQILHVFGDMNIFKKLLIDEENPELHTMPLAKIFDIEDEDFIKEGINLNKVMEGLAGIIVRVVNIMPEVYSLVDGDFSADATFVGDLLQGDLLDTLGEMLAILLNKDDDFEFKNGKTVKVMGTGPMLRGFIAKEFEKQIGGGEGPFATFADEFIKLFDKPNNDWVFDIKSIAAQFVQDTIDDALEGTGFGVSLGKDADEKVAVMDILLDMIIGEQGLASWLNRFESEPFEDFADITEMFGGVNGVKALSDAGFRITAPTVGLPESPFGECWYCLFERYIESPEVSGNEDYVKALWILFLMSECTCD